MPTQMRLFSGVLERRDVWGLDKNGLAEARDITHVLLGEAANGVRQWPVTLWDVARFKLGLPDSADVPVAQVVDFKNLVDQLRDERFRLKDAIESLGEYQLVFVNEEGGSSLAGGRRPTMGFQLRDSEAGLAHDKQQLKMHFGAIERVVAERHLEQLVPVMRSLRSGVLGEIQGEIQQPVEP